jgi:hypothetical protein
MVPAVLVALLVAGAVWLAPHAPRFAEAIARCPAVLGVCLLGGAAFAVLRAVQLRSAGRATGMPLSGRSAAAVFCEGIAVEAVTWPGKLWADAYRYRRLGPRGPARQRLAVLLRYRAGGAGGTPGRRRPYG